jgi:hypothetical protein
MDTYCERKETLHSELKNVLAMSVTATRDDAVWAGCDDEIEDGLEVSE